MLCFVFFCSKANALNKKKLSVFLKKQIMSGQKNHTRYFLFLNINQYIEMFFFSSKYLQISQIFFYFLFLIVNYTKVEKVRTRNRWC